MGAFSLKIVACDGKSSFRNLAVLLENISCYRMLRYLINDSETVLSIIT
jgi:hypothetical protein